MKKPPGLTSRPIQTLLCLVTLLLLTLTHAPAAESPLTEIIDLVLSNQKSSSSFDDGERFDLLMVQLGAAEARRSKAETDKLTPAHLEDRLRIIALQRHLHRALFDGIYYVYVRHPSDAEIEKLQKEYLILHPPGSKPHAADGSVRDPLALSDRRISAPAVVEALHLTAPYHPCFEYYWLAPKSEPALLHSDATLANALDHIKKQVKQIDIRILVEARLYAELEAHLQTLKLVGTTLDELKDRIGPPAFEFHGAHGYSFHIGGKLHAYYLGQMQDGKLASFKRIPEDEWRSKSDQSPSINPFYTPSKKP